MSRLGMLLQERRLLLAPGVYDALSALIAEQAGARAVYLSGASLAYPRLGRSDIGLVDMTAAAPRLASIRERIDLPIIADADTGFGNALNVQRTVRTFERSGADAIQLEDQTMPKRCGHLDGKSVIPPQEMVGKIKAACDARRSGDTLIVARTDAVAVEGLEPALARAMAYREAGADILFVEALRTREEMKAAVSQLGADVPLLVNVVEGGKTPALPLRELEEIGFRIAIYPGGAVRAVAHQLAAFYGTLVRDGTTAPFADRMLDFTGLNRVIGTPELLELGRRYGA